MPTPNPDLVRTYETIHPTKLELVTENASNYIYICPWCADKFGTPDKKGKLYIDKFSKKGICFRCNTAVFPSEKDKDDEVIDKEAQILVKELEKRDYSVREYINKVSVDISEMPEWYDDFTVASYILNERGPHIAELANYCRFKAFIGSKKGVYIPFIINNKCVSYQIRYTSGDRYFTKPGVKYLYSPGGIDLEITEEVTLCEGVFDAIALKYLGEKNPIAILGSSLSPFQIFLLRNLAVDIYRIAMDDRRVCWSIISQLRKDVPLIQDIQPVLFNGYKDPDDFVKRSLSI